MYIKNCLESWRGAGRFVAFSLLLWFRCYLFSSSAFLLLMQQRSALFLSAALTRSQCMTAHWKITQSERDFKK